MNEKKEANKVQHRMAKKEVKKAVVVAKNNAFERLYQRLDSKEGEKEAFKLARARERRTRNLSSVRCIKDEEGRVLIEDTKVQERWQSYFYRLFNREKFDVAQHMEQVAREEQHNSKTCGPITREDIMKALRKTKARKAIGPDGIPVEIWNTLGAEDLNWLTGLFNVIFETITMPSDWRHGTIIPLYKSKRDIQDYNNYRGIKLLSHTIKI